jgi:DNA-binding response OmpR family regulator
MLTALTQESDRERGRAVGADDYVPKPFRPSDLLDRSDEAMREQPGRSAKRLRNVSHP